MTVVAAVPPLIVAVPHPVVAVVVIDHLSIKE
jgi:hypothetical protein